MLRNFFCASFFVSLCSCAVAAKHHEPKPAANPPNDTAHLTQVFSQQSECYNAWSRLVSDWEDAGGGFKTSLLSTRKQIASDNTSAFATIVRKVWAAQSAKEGTNGVFGHWPISTAELDIVIRNPNSEISGTLDRYLPKGCGAFTWLYPVIWDQTHTVAAGKISVMRFTEMPGRVDWDSYSEPRWVLYWMFVRSK